MATKRKTADTLHHDIAVRAYLIWESEGCPRGREAEHWRRAEAEILAAQKKKAPARKKKAAAKSAPKSNPKSKKKS
jgi:hypothetical protein